MRKLSVAAFLVAYIFLLFLASGVQFHIVSAPDHSKTLVYSQPGKFYGSGPVAADLREQMISVYGAENTPAEQYRGPWQDRQIKVWDTVQYTLTGLGRAPSGGIYVQCSAAITRTAADQTTGQTIGCTPRTCTYLGYDDDDMSSTVRAQILWDTLEETYSDGQAYFDQWAQQN